MGDLLGENSDLEINKYYEADEMFNNAGNPAAFKNKKSVFLKLKSI